MKSLFFITLLFISLTSILSFEYYLIKSYPACSGSYSSIVDALKSIGVNPNFCNRNSLATINEISDYSGKPEQNIQLLNLLKEGKLKYRILIKDGVEQNSEKEDYDCIENEFEYTDKPDIEKEEEEEKEKEKEKEKEDDNAISKMISNFEKSTSYSSKKSALVIIAKVLFENGYEASFVAGILGNIYHEGSIGKFESSAYISNPSAEPQYLKYMDQSYNY
jgi:hypothetical protein